MQHGLTLFYFLWLAQNFQLKFTLFFIFLLGLAILVFNLECPDLKIKNARKRTFFDT
ncbi:hypothetical protein ACIRA0001_0634 [Acinetobacter radioresistens SK82]|uniref:Uncharacterized protein n=1 Tax=Acinetobacter radioresistens SK82 TaxID=596318 RepID=A0ABM9YLM8_ACIRA|nr:hypothetical protein ACIRA0001_0634 [Acinetobacter radioresistens SK82]EXB87245.1 hypothetical protein J538_0739 [Acinetobacter sp. 272263]EXE59127.1 hypothetical protein J579_1005 [Acinetobacter sp. 1239920]